ncbi:MAG: bifunctional 4-hydroxy-3-methylbut-2-enyl diphosphate reductase/30S ribosomal protein S1 [Ruminococcaceae bacterium]|nr:bifunctional 4-hydroxy-3-methylbut-2-enyl diphosphate reductase/30S ribosomal protein S1 [Oscillospiraceae bacterium]
MKITLAKTAGFCFGVNRAVNMVYELLDKGEKVCTLGPIIHNPQLVKELEDRGVRIVESPSEVVEGETLVIRSHGVSAAVFKEAEQKNLKIADATCPFVSKIHKIVAEKSGAGYVTVIAGDENHQEVKGIIGHCTGECFVISTVDELNDLLKEKANFEQKSVILVSQTTFNAEIWEEIQKNFKKVCTNAEIFDTICNATSMRQAEAESLSKINDVILVIGGRHSSNTAKLYDVCSNNCKRTHYLETADELSGIDLKDSDLVGVVAGASTPAGIIKEVIYTMSENLQPVEEQMEVKESVQKSFEEMTDEEAFEASLSSLTGDQKVEGTVIAVNPTEITVDIGRGVTGYVTAAEYSSDPNVKMEDEVKVNDKINLIIMKISDQEGTAMLSKRRYDAIAGWDNIVAAKESGEVITGFVKEIIKGGVVVYTNNVRVFIPASQATLSRSEALEDLKGKEVSFRIIEIGRGRRAVGSIRSVLREERKAAQAKLWSEIAVGDRFTGTVKSITGYGAFVDIGGVDGMVHISELSWSRIKNPSEVVLVGDTVEVYVKAIDVEKKKISLGYKKEEENPWVIFQNNYNVDDVVKVTIVSMTTYGAFARIIPGIDGLIHISQIANKHIAKPQDELTVGQEVEAKITAVDFDKKRVSLSIRALLEPEVKEEEPAVAEADEVVYEATEENAPAAEEVAEEIAPVAEETTEVVEEVAEETAE